jgi:hypothetical protein
VEEETDFGNFPVLKRLLHKNLVREDFRSLVRNAFGGKHGFGEYGTLHAFHEGEFHVSRISRGRVSRISKQRIVDFKRASFTHFKTENSGFQEEERTRFEEGGSVVHCP